MRPTIQHAARSARLALLCAGLAACAPLQAPGREAPQSIAIWRDLTASLPHDAGPKAAYLFVNLGNAYLLNGDYDAARVALERACLLDPLVARSWQLLGDALAALGQDARARQMQRQAAALRQHDLRADFAAAGGQTGVAALGQAMQAPPLTSAPVALPVSQPATHSGWAQAQIHVGVDGMMELRRIPASTHVARLEISNGNGVTGMARLLARQIDEPDVQVTRVSNQPGFAVRHTRIEYEAAYFDAAHRLAQRLGSAQLQEVERSGPANLRLVLGRDLARHGTALRLGAGAAESLSLSLSLR